MPISFRVLTTYVSLPTFQDSPDIALINNDITEVARRFTSLRDLDLEVFRTYCANKVHFTTLNIFDTSDLAREARAMEFAAKIRASLAASPSPTYAVEPFKSRPAGNAWDQIVTDYYLHPLERDGNYRHLGHHEQAGASQQLSVLVLESDVVTIL